MKKNFLMFMACVILIGAGLGLAGGSQAESKQVFKLKLANWYPVGHMMYDAMEQYIQRVEELSDGRIKVEHYPSAQLGKINDMLELASMGAADITPVVPQLYPGHLPLNTVIGLPYWTTAVEGSEIYDRLFESVPELSQEFAKYKVKKLFAFTTSQYDVGTVNTPVRSPEDLKGLKLTTTGGLIGKIAAKYGVNPVSISTAEMYEATQKNIVEGNILSHTSRQGYRLNELEKFMTNGLRMGGVVTVIVINENSWQKLPEDLQKALLQASIEAGKNAAAGWDKVCNEVVNQFQKGGMTVYTIKPEERAKWDEPLKGIEEVWISDMNQKGLPGQKVFDAYYKICKEVAK